MKDKQRNRSFISPEEEAERQAMREQYHLQRTPIVSRRSSRSTGQEANAESSRPAPDAPEIYQQCLLLHTQNKINSKNAFNLELIDALPALSNLEPGRLDFAYVGKLISVAAKIYGCRVDNVCHETHELYNEALRSESKSGNKKDGNEDDEGEKEEGGKADETLAEPTATEKVKEKKLKKRLKNAKQDKMDLDCQLEKCLSKITMAEDDFEEALDPVYVFAKRFHDECGAEAAMCQAYHVIDDFCQTSVTLLPNVNNKWPSVQSEQVTRRLDRVAKKIGSMDYVGSTLSYKCRYADYADAPGLEEFARSIGCDLSDNYEDDAGTLVADEMQLDATILPVAEPVFDAPNEDDGSHSDDEVACCLPTVLDLKSAYASLARQNLEYSYINLKTVPIFNGPTRWKEPLERINDAKKPKALVRKKKASIVEPLHLEPITSTAFQKACREGRPGTTINLETLDELNSVKNEINDEPYDVESLFRLYSKNTRIAPVLTGCYTTENALNNNNDDDEGEEEEEENNNEADNPFEQEGFLMNDSLSHCDIAMDEHQDVPLVYASDSCEGEDGALSGDELSAIIGSVPASQQQMPVTARIRRVDVARTKRAIAHVLKRQQNEEPVGENRADEQDDFHPRDFSKIFRTLVRQPKLKKDVTVQSAFVCMLHMCNENTLQLISKENGDFTVNKA